MPERYCFGGIFSPRSPLNRLRKLRLRRRVLLRLLEPSALGVELAAVPAPPMPAWGRLRSREVLPVPQQFVMLQETRGLTEMMKRTRSMT